MPALFARRNRRSTALMPVAASLDTLAQSTWGPLSEAEKQLVHAAERRPSNQPTPDIDVVPGSTNFSSSDKHIRAGLLRWLCTDAAALVAIKGIRVRGAQINDTLDLESVTCNFPLYIEDSTIAGAVNLNFAKFPYIRISETSVEKLHAIRLRLEGTLFLVGLRVKDEVALQGAIINGNLVLDKSVLSCPGGCALNLENANIGGAVNMRHGFRSDGHIRLFSTQIGKNLECTGTIIATLGSQALLIESAKIGGSALLRHGFRSLGQVRIYETIIDGTLDMRSARLTASGKAALAVIGCRIKGSVLLLRDDAKYRSRCVGGVRIRRSIIEGDLDLTNAHLRARAWPAADMLDLKIEGRLIAEGARIDGEFVLARAIVRNDSIFFGMRLNNPGGRALRARGFHCGGSFLLGDQFRSNGKIELFGAFIGDEFNAVGSEFDNKGGVALEISEAAIQRFASCTNCKVNGSTNWAGTSVGSTMNFSGTSFEGELNLKRTQIGGDLVLRGAKLGTRAMLQASSLRCKGHLFLDSGFEALGGALLYGAVVDGDFHSSNAVYGDGKDRSLVLTRARIGGHFLLNKSRLNGTASLELASIAGRLSFSHAVLSAQRDMRNPVTALNAKDCVIGGGAAFDDGFTARGGVVLERALITGSLRLTNSSVFNRQSDAFSLVGATIAGDIDAGLAFSFNRPNLDTRLLGVLNLSKASIDGNVDLTGMSILNRSGMALHAAQMRVKGAFDLRYDFRTNGGIDLHLATVGSYFDDEKSWCAARDLHLDGLTYAAILPADSASRIRWLEQAHRRPLVASEDMAIEPNHVFLQPYEQLVQTLRKQGHERDARKVAIAKQYYIGKRLDGGARWIHRFYGFTMQYGYRPQRALLFAPAFLIAACTFFYTGADTLMVPSNADAAKAMKKNVPLPPGYPSFNAVAYSVEMLVPILNLQQKESWRPDDKAACDPGPNRCGFWLRFYLWLHMAAGWIITTLAVAGFTGLVRKD